MEKLLNWQQTTWKVLHDFLFLMTKFINLFSAAQNAGRASYILGRGSQPVANKRDMYLSLWKNYVVMGCCITPPSQLPDHRSVSPNLK